MYWIKVYWTSIKRVIRAWPLLILSILLMYPWGARDDSSMLSTLHTVAYVTGISFFLLFMTHVGRVLFLPDMDLDKLYEKATETPISAAIVFAAISVIISILLICLMTMFR